MKLFRSLILAALVGHAAADILVNNELINTDEIYDFVYSTDSDEWWRSENTKKYYCMYRNLWTKVDHPAKYPRFARLSDVIMYTSTTGFTPWLKSKRITAGIESLVEAGFNAKFLTEITRAGDQILDQCKADAFTIDQGRWEKNFVFMDGLEVTDTHRYLNGITAMLPSPDWFTGFYLFDTVDEFDRTFFNEFLLHTYAWDGGTDNGNTYEAFDSDAVPALAIERFTSSNTPGGIFVSQEGSVKPVGEIDCRLYVCDPTVDAACEMPGWPPENGCDIFRFPNCDQKCNPISSTVCEECKPQSGDNEPVYYQNCCNSNREPFAGDCVNGAAVLGTSGAASITGVSLAASVAVTGGVLGLFL